MERITCHELPDLFQGAADIFGEKKEELCEMDARMGDGDLGLTMQKGFGALPQLIRDNEAEGDIGKTLMKAGMKMAALVPSTMGTLMSSGIMEGGKAIGKKGEMGPGELADFLAGFARGIAHRGKCQLGDRTILDAVDAGARKAQEACAEGADMGAMLRRAAEGEVWKGGCVFCQSQGRTGPGRCGGTIFSGRIGEIFSIKRIFL